MEFFRTFRQISKTWVCLLSKGFTSGDSGGQGEFVRVFSLQHVGAVLRLLQQPPLHDEAEHLFVGQPLVRLLCQGGDLPQHNSKRPAGRGEGRQQRHSCWDSRGHYWKRHRKKDRAPGRSPDIRVGGEDAVLQGLGRHPADGEQTFAAFTVVIRLVDVSGHAKVCTIDYKRCVSKRDKNKMDLSHE